MMRPKRHIMREVIIPAIAIVTIIVVGYISQLTFSQDLARAHGAQEDEMSASLPYMLDRNANTPLSDARSLESIAGDIPSHSLVMLYRYGCDDCARTYHATKDYLDAHAPNTRVYWVPSRSALGEKLRQRVDVHEVPVAIAYNNADDLALYEYSTPDGIDEGKLESAIRYLHEGK